MMLDDVGWNATWFVVKWLAEEKTCSWHLQPSVPCLGSVWRFMANFRIQCMLLHGHSLCFLPGCNCDFLPVLAEYQSATIEPRNHATKQNSSSTTWVCWSDMSEITSAKFKLPQCHREIKKFVEVLTGSCCQPVSMARTHRCWCQTSLWPPWGKWLLKCLFASFPCSVLCS